MAPRKKPNTKGQKKPEPTSRPPVKKKPTGPTVESLVKIGEKLSKRNEELEKEVAALRSEAGFHIIATNKLKKVVDEQEETIDDLNVSFHAFKKMAAKATAKAPITVPAMINKARMMTAINELKQARPELTAWLDSLTNFINL